MRNTIVLILLGFIASMMVSINSKIEISKKALEDEYYRGFYEALDQAVYCYGADLPDWTPNPEHTSCELVDY